ncbi:hypothetical protein ACFLXY_00500 [Chloroflexota bacterium]
MSGITTDGFTPEEILATLPVYPGSELSTYLESESIPRSTPLSTRTAYADPDEPKYRIASEEYKVSDSMGDVIDWYKAWLDDTGYHGDGESNWYKDEVAGRIISYYLPSHPYINIEVHAYTGANLSLPVYKLMVVENVLLSLPYDEDLLPDDINRVTVKYDGYASRTITDQQTITELVALVNSLPVRPNYVFMGIHRGKETVFKLGFHSPLRGTITVTDLLGGENSGINIEGHPVLWDTHNILRDKVKDLAQTDNSGG